MWHLLHLNHGQQPWSTTHEWIRELFIWCSTYHMIFMPSECVSLSDCLSAYLWLSIWKFFPQHAISNLKFKTRIISNKCIHYKTLSLFLMLRSGYPWGILICQLRLCCLVVHKIWATVREWLPAVTPVHFQDRPLLQALTSKRNYVIIRASLLGSMILNQKFCMGKTKYAYELVADLSH